MMTSDRFTPLVVLAAIVALFFIAMFAAEAAAAEPAAFDPVACETAASGPTVVEPAPLATAEPTELVAAPKWTRFTFDPAAPIVAEPAFWEPTGSATPCGSRFVVTIEPVSAASGVVQASYLAAAFSK